MAIGNLSVRANADEAGRGENDVNGLCCLKAPLRRDSGIIGC